jgi:hypothetical protein
LGEDKVECLPRTLVEEGDTAGLYAYCIVKSMGRDWRATTRIEIHMHACRTARASSRRTQQLEIQIATCLHIFLVQHEEIFVLLHRLILHSSVHPMTLCSMPQGKPDF